VLTLLDIRNVVLIEALRLEPGAGLGVLTGETGAGKSILLDALGLALGGRGDAGLVRAGADAARVTAGFEVPADHPVYALLAENDLEIEAGGPVLLRRQVKPDGGSRAFINDQPVSVALLREAGGLLVEVHGQNDERGLLAASGHRALLDAYGGLYAELSTVRSAYAGWRAAEAAEAEAKAALEADRKDREWLDHAITELRALAAEPGEEASLAEARTAMQRGARLADDLGAAATLIGEGSDRLSQAARRLDRMGGEHPLLDEALSALDRALLEASEADRTLAAATAALEADPARLEATETRLFELRAMARKHRTEAEQLPALLEHLQARAAALVAGEDSLAIRSEAVRVAAVAYARAADALGAARRAAASRLDAAVMAELEPLKLGAARFRTSVSPQSDDHMSAEGRERVAFEISTNPGAEFAPLIKIASGGELSRFVLALKVALAGEGVAGTLIFDEIDRGVGGAVASAIGERLSRLASQTQVLVVTHSPQVAARGRQQMRISKASDASGTRTQVIMLDDAGRLEEIARMLSGAEVTAEARAQAARLLA
jgi:DNA repair protein RecN (Recombination protein N)